MEKIRPLLMGNRFAFIDEQGKVVKEWKWSVSDKFQASVKRWLKLNPQYMATNLANYPWLEKFVEEGK